MPKWAWSLGWLTPFFPFPFFIFFLIFNFFYFKKVKANTSWRVKMIIFGFSHQTNLKNWQPWQKVSVLTRMLNTTRSHWIDCHKIILTGSTNQPLVTYLLFCLLTGCCVSLVALTSNIFQIISVLMMICTWFWLQSRSQAYKIVSI